MIKTGAPNGYLYNWYAATASAGTYEVSSGSVTTSICPKGWTLPTGGPGGQFSALSVAYGGPTDDQSSGQGTVINNLITTPAPAFNWTGYRLGSSINYPSDNAYYWSRTTLGPVVSYYLQFSAYGMLKPQGSYDKFGGFAVRCILQPTMQNFTAPDSSVAVGTTKELVDTRDNRTYLVGKLEDQNWWMVENLRLVGPMTLTSDDSNISTNASFNLTASDNSTWCIEDSSECDDQSMVLDSGNQTYGTYYNWYAATAGTGTYSTTSGNASSSICPKGWKLPTGGASGDFVNLDKAMGGDGTNRTDSTQSTNLRAVDGPNFVLSGYRYTSGFDNLDVGGFYWSSTAYHSSGFTYLLYLSSSYMAPQDANHGYVGRSVRCIVST